MNECVLYVRWGEGAMNGTHDTISHQGAQGDSPTVQQYDHSLVLLPRDQQMMSSNKGRNNSNIFLTQALC